MTPTLSPVSERTKEIVRLAKEGEIERLLVDDPDRLPEVLRLCYAAVELLKEEQKEISERAVFDTIRSFVDRASFVKDDILIDVSIDGRRIPVSEIEMVDCDRCGFCFKGDRLAADAVCPSCGNVSRL